MKTTSQIITFGSLCLLLAGTATATLAQDDHQDHHGDQGGYGQHQDGQYGQHQDGQYGQHQDGQYGQHQDGDYRHSDQYRHANQNERRRLDRLHAAYARAAYHGNYGAAERAHQHAQAIRAHIRDQHSDQHHDGDHGQYQGDQHDHHGDNQGDQHPHDNN